MNTSTNDSAPEAVSNTVWGTTAFVPGQDVGLVARHTIGLIERNNPSTRDRLWGLVSSDSPLDDILDELSSTGLKALPDFGIAQVDGDSVRVVARGRTVVTAELASGATHVVDATTVRTWLEEALSDVVSVRISLDPAADDDVVEVGEGDTFAVLAGSVPAASLTRRYDVPDPHAAQAEGWPGFATVDDVSSGGSDPVVATPPLADGISDESWFDETSTDDVPDEAMPSSPQPPAPVIGGAADPSLADAPPPAGPPPHFDDPVPPPESTILVDPGDATRAPTPFDLEADLADSLGDDDSVGAGSTVLGILAFSNGDRIAVDRSVLIGRNPKIVAAIDGALPHIMKFEGPGQGLSRTHAEVRIENGELLLEDLNSTNGTEVELPGEPRRRLSGGEPVVIVAGTLIDFGDELRCVVESAW